MSEKLQKVLARVGLGSRRAMEAWVSAGRVSVNNRVAKLGDRITPGDKLRVDGRTIDFDTEGESVRRVILYNKPEGEICTRNDPDGRPTPFDHLPRLHVGRWIVIGRLDINSQGLLLFTTDGELANKLMHPESAIEREYAVRVRGQVTDEMLDTLRKGVMLEDGMAKFDGISISGGDATNRWYHVLLREGKKREVRRLWESQGVQVSRLIRVRFANLALPRAVRSGRWIELDKAAIDGLAKMVDLPSKKKTGVLGQKAIDRSKRHNLKARKLRSTVSRRRKR